MVCREILWVAAVNCGSVGLESDLTVLSRDAIRLIGNKPLSKYLRPGKFSPSLVFLSFDPSYYFLLPACQLHYSIFTGAKHGYKRSKGLKDR